MTYRIAVAGKGGTGKTTISALIIYHLLKKNKTPILAVDADPNSNLNEGIGLNYEHTVSEIREDIPDKSVPSGISKTDYVNQRIEQDVIVEAKGVDLLVMGHPEGRGCYCFVNELLRNYLSRLSGSYRYLLIDSEAGMEHLSRRTTDDLDLLILVSDHTSLGIRTAARLVDTAKNVKLKIKKTGVIINKSKSQLTPEQKNLLDKAGLELMGMVPEDDLVYKYREQGKSLLDLPEDCEVVKTVEELTKGI